MNVYLYSYMKGIGLNCIVNWFICCREMEGVENYISESLYKLKQISNEIRIKYIDLTEWWAVDIAWKGTGVKDWWKFLLKFQVSLYVAIENLNPVRSGKLYFYPPYTFLLLTEFSHLRFHVHKNRKYNIWIL